MLHDRGRPCGVPKPISSRVQNFRQGRRGMQGPDMKLNFTCLNRLNTVVSVAPSFSVDSSILPLSTPVLQCSSAPVLQCPYAPMQGPLLLPLPSLPSRQHDSSAAMFRRVPGATVRFISVCNHRSNNLPCPWLSWQLYCSWLAG